MNSNYEHQWQWLALFVPDAALRERWRHALESSPRFSYVSVAENWLLATHPLGATPAQAPELRRLSSGGTLCVIAGATEIETAAGGFGRFEEYTLHNPSRLGEFPGDITAFSLFPDGRALLQRSVSGIPGLYAAQGRTFCALSTCLDWISLCLPNSATLDWLPIALYNAGWPAFPEGRCPLRGVHLLPRGHFLEIRPDEAVRPFAYWTPPPMDTSTSRESGHALAAAVRDSLDHSLSHQLSAADENVLLFSAGLDSAAVAATARFLGFPLQALSALPPDGSPEQAREREYQQRLSPWFTQHKTCTLDSPPLLETHSRCPLAYYPIPHFFTLIEQHGFSPKVICSGWFADEVLGISRYPDLFEAALDSYLPRLVAHTPLRAQALQRWHRYRHGPSVPNVPTRLTRPFLALLGDEYREWYTREVLDQGRQQPPLWRAFPLADRALVLSESAARSGATLAMPFFSRRLLDVAFSAHPFLLFNRRFTKVPLRSAMAGRLPREFLERTDKGNYALGKPLAELPRERLSRMISALDPLLDKAAFQSQARLTWDDQFDLCTVSRVSEHHQALTYERQQIIDRHRLPST